MMPSWKEIEKNLIRLLGENYHQYPRCMEWNIKMMKYRARIKEEKELLEKVEDVENG